MRKQLVNDPEMSLWEFLCSPGLERPMYPRSLYPELTAFPGSNGVFDVPDLACAPTAYGAAIRDDLWAPSDRF